MPWVREVGTGRLTEAKCGASCCGCAGVPDLVFECGSCRVLGKEGERRPHPSLGAALEAHEAVAESPRRTGNSRSWGHPGPYRSRPSPRSRQNPRAGLIAGVKVTVISASGAPQGRPQRSFASPSGGERLVPIAVSLSVGRGSYGEGWPGKDVPGGRDGETAASSASA